MTVTGPAASSPGWLLRGGTVSGAPADVRVHKDRIVEIGPSLVGAGEEVVEATGRVLLPGRSDAHVHFMTWALTRRTADLNASLALARSARDAAKAVVLARTDRTTWLRGAGFQQARWPADPHKSLLDAAAPDQPVVLTSHDVHSSWWSSAALAAVGLADHPDGYLRERESWEALARIPPPSPDEVAAAVGAAMADASQRGVTTITDFEFGGAVHSWTHRSQTLAAAGDWLPVRVTASLVHDELEQAIEDQWRTGAATDRTGMVRIGGLKLFSDGALGSRTAWCDHHYVGEPDNHGRALLGEDELRATITTADAAGLSLHVHAIGDTANRMVLDAFAATGVRGTIEHAQLLDRADLIRFSSLTTAASVQPSHAVDDRHVAEQWWADRLDRAYPLRSLMGAGVQLAFGSDAPVAPLDPWRTIAAAVARTLDDLPPWLPSQAVPLQAALSFSGGRSLRVGDPADLLIMHDDPSQVAVTDLAGVRVHATMCAGRWTHGPEAGNSHD